MYVCMYVCMLPALLYEHYVKVRLLHYLHYLTGVWGIGVATRNCDVQKVPLGCDSDSWVLRHDGTLFHNDTEVSRLTPLPEEGDVIVSVTCAVFIIVKCLGATQRSNHGFVSTPTAPI